MKKVLLILIPLLLLLGIGVGLAYIGVVKVPFLPFGKKKPIKVPADDGKGGPLAPYLATASSLVAKMDEEAKQAKKAVVDPPKPPPDTSAGEAKLAGIWAEMPTDHLVALIEKWPKDQLGRILAKMDGDATTSLLAAVPPPRAAELSQAIAVATDESAQKVHAN